MRGHSLHIDNMSGTAEWTSRNTHFVSQNHGNSSYKSPGTAGNYTLSHG